MVDLCKTHGYRFSVVTPRIFAQSKRIERNRSETIYRFDFLSENRLLVDYDRIPICRMITYMLGGLLKAFHVVRHDHCDLIHAHFSVPAGLIGVIIARISGRRIVLTAHGTDITWRGSDVVRQCSRFALRHADHIVVNSAYTHKEVLDLMKRKTPIEIIYAAGVNTERFHPSNNGFPKKGELGLCDTDFVTLYVGNLTERKRVGDLIRAMARLRQFHPQMKLIVAGDGELRKRLEALAGREGLNGVVGFTGRVPDNMLPSLYALADVFVLPSKEEGLGVVLLEAMASGKPVVASRTSGILSVIEDQRTGLLFEPGDIDDLVAKIRMLVDNRDLRTKLGQRARMEAVRKFAEEAQVQKLLRVYENCLSS
jgi:N-acetyl-alpha-D-glucosaminyl L-malate synthase BshA